MPMPRNNPGDTILASEWNTIADQVDVNADDIADVITVFDDGDIGDILVKASSSGGTSSVGWSSAGELERNRFKKINPRDYSPQTLTGNASIDTAALQWAIDTALNEAATDPATQYRNALYSIEIPIGDWLINAPLTIKSATGLEFIGQGARTQLRPVTDMAAVLDIDGSFGGRFGHFSIEATSLTPKIDRAISYQWTTAASRSSSNNTFENIEIRNTRFGVGFGIADAPGSNARQIDETSYRDILINGDWDYNTGTLGGDDYQAAIRIGGASFGNVINHVFDKLGTGATQIGVDIKGVITVNVRGFSMGRHDLAVKTAGGFGITFDGGRFERIRQMLSQLGGSAPATISFRNTMMSLDLLRSDGRIVDWRSGGNLTLDNVIFNPVTKLAGSADAHIYTATATPHSIHLSGVGSSQLLPGPGASDFVKPGGSIAACHVTYNGYQVMSAGGGVVDIEP